MSNIILTLTLLAIIWYTIETRKLRVATIHATELDFRPIIVISQEGSSNDLFIENVGRGHAMNVVCSFIVESKDSASVVPMEGYISLLNVNDKKRFVEVFSGEANQNLGKILEANLDPRVARYNIEIIVKYSDISGKRYLLQYRKEPKTNLLIVKSEKLKERDQRIVDA